MRKLLLIFSVVLAAILVSGGIFLLGSGGAPEPVEAIVYSPNEDMLQTTEFYQKQGRFDEAYPLLRDLMEKPLTEDLLREVTFRLGAVFFDDYRENGTACLDSAETYLFSAFSMDGDHDLQLKAGKLLLDVRAEKGVSKPFFDLIDQLLAMDLSDDELANVWQRKFDFLFESDLPWQDLQNSMVVAETYPLSTPRWTALVQNVRLRINERLLRDPVWFEQYAQSVGLQNRAQLRQKLFDDAGRVLTKQMQSAPPEEKSNLALRQGLLMAAVGDFENAKLNLRLALESDASTDLLQALELVLSLFGESADEIELQQFVTQLLHGRNYNTGFSRAEKLRIVDMLTILRRYDDALKVIDVDLKMKASTPGRDELLAMAVILETQQEHIDVARDYMDELFAMGVSEPFGQALKNFIDIQLARNEYGLVEEWGLRYIGGVPADSAYARDVLFALFDTSYWMNRPALEKLYIGAAAVEASPNDERVASAILRMAGFVEDLGLPSLAGTYYNRIGLLNFFQEGPDASEPNRNIGEQAMLGKARCLKKAEEWGRADHLFRDLSHRTASPLIRSEIAVLWAELSLQFGQRVEAGRRYDMADPQLLSPDLRARYQLGQARLRNQDLMQDVPAIEDALMLLERLPDSDRPQATIDFYNETFDFLSETENERAISRLIDLACQSEFSDQIPVQSYVLKTLLKDVEIDQVETLNEGLQGAVMPDKASVLDLAQSVNRLERLSKRVALHSKRSEDNE